MLSSRCSISFIKVFTSTVLLVGCSLPKTGSSDENESAASYTIASTKAEMTETKMIDGFSIPASKTFHFKVCLQDKQRGKPISNHNFTITGAAKDIDATSDGEGCLNWDEEIAYNHFSHAHPVPMDRVFHPHGFHRGLRTVHWGVNPWEDQALDLDKNTMNGIVDKSQAESTLRTYSEPNKVIVMSEIRLNSELKSNSGKGALYSFDFNGQTGFESKSVSNEVKFNPITQGHFKWKAHLIYSYTGASSEVHEELFSTDQQDITLSHGSLAVHFEQVLSHIPKLGSYYLGVEMETVLPAPYQIGKAQSVFLISSDSSKLDGNFTLKPTSETLSDANFSVQKFLDEKPAIGSGQTSNQSKDNADNTRDAGFETKKLEATVIDYKGSKGNDRVTHFIFEIGVENKIFNSTVIGYNFVVTKTNGEKVSGTPSDGKFSWDETFTYKFEKRECELPYEVTIAIPDLGFSQKVPVYVNPWEGKVIDLHATPALQAKGPQCSDGNIGITDSSVTVTKAEIKYEVDEYLNLIVKKVVNFNLWLASMVRPSLLADPSGVETVSIPLDKYKLRMALLDQYADFNNLKASDVIWTNDGEAATQENRPGLLQGQTVITIDNMKDLNSTLKFVLLIEPTDQQNEVQHVAQWGNMVVANESDFPNLVPINSLDGKQLMDSIRDLKTQRDAAKKAKWAALAGKENFAKNMRLVLVNSDDRNSVQGFLSRINQLLKLMSKPELTTGGLNEQIAAGGDNTFAAAMAQYWFQFFLRTPWTDQKIVILDMKKSAALSELSRKLTSEALKNPRSVFDIQQRVLVDQPTVTSHSGGSQYDFGVKQGIAAESANVKSQDSTWSAVQALGLAAKLSFLKFFGIEAEFGLSHSNSLTSGTHWAAENSTSSGGVLDLQVDQKNLNLHSDSAETCIVYKLKPEVITKNNLMDLMNPQLSAQQRQQASLMGFMFWPRRIEPKTNRFQRELLFSQSTHEPKLAHRYLLK